MDELKQKFLEEEIKKQIYNYMNAETPSLSEMKMYYDRKNNEFVYITARGEKYTTKCNEQDDFDIYIGAALALAKAKFGSTTKFRKWVDRHFKGKKPEDYKKQYSKPFVENRTLEEAIAEECKYSEGDRVLFRPSTEARECIGTIEGYDFETQEYLIKWDCDTFRVKDVMIIRKCRKANKSNGN